MADADLIARLYEAHLPGIDHAGKMLNLVENQSRFLPAPVPPSSQSTEEDSAQEQVPPSSQITDEDSVQEQDTQQSQGDMIKYEPCLELRFSNGPKTSLGFVFGTHKECDIVLPRVKGISQHQFCLLFDYKNRIIIRDLDSTNGMAVLYGNQDHVDVRKNFTWIIGGHILAQNKKILLQVHQYLTIEIVVPDYAINSPALIENVNKFRQGSAKPESLFAKLDLDLKRETELLTKQPGTTSTSGAILSQGKLIGNGGFGIVSHVFDVSNGDEYALKEPTEAMWAPIHRARVREMWKKEATVMSVVNHENIVKCLDHTDGVDDIRPHLKLEFMPHGSFNSLENVTLVEYMHTSSQILAALAYLHDRKIVHRDVKGGNILVYARPDTGAISVKLSDFGMYKDSIEPVTIQGTEYHFAPEMFDEKDRRIEHNGSPKRSFTPAIDLWALGVVLSRGVVAEMPDYPKSFDQSWCAAITNAVESSLDVYPSNFKKLVAKLVSKSVKSRGTASECYEIAKTLVKHISSEDRAPTPTQDDIIRPAGAYAAESGQDTVKPPPHNNQSKDKARALRSGGPGPSSTLKRPFSESSASGQSDDPEPRKAPSYSGMKEMWADAMHPWGGGSSLCEQLEFSSEE